MKVLLPIVTLALTACGSSPAENKADQLENAAEQSTPAAAEILDNAAEGIEAGNGQNADAEAQNALEQAGDVEAAQH
jgi:Tfp pilus assembly protein PilF